MYKTTPIQDIADTILHLREIAKDVKLLLVEDDPALRQEYKIFLGQYFSDIDTSEDGILGLDASQKKSYDIILSDIAMPQMNGLDMIQLIKEKNPDQITILLSAHKDPKVLHRSVSLGVDGYLFKPLHKEQALTLFRKILENIHRSNQSKYYQEELESLVVSKTQEVIKNFTIDKITGLYTLAKIQHDISTNRSQSIALLKIRAFKNLNDFYGYETGDTVLFQTAKILKQFYQDKEKDFTCNLYRISGAHFAVLCDMTSEQLFTSIQEFVTHFEYIEIDIDSEAIFLEMDAGVVDNSCETSISNADKALRVSEKEGRLVLYKDDSTTIEEHKTKLKCKDSIKRAVYEKRFIPYYQPIVDNKTKTIQKYEALVRMVMPEGEIMSPARFLPVAKETKMYSAITKEMVKRVFQDFRDSECSVSINLSIDDIKNNATREYLRFKLSKFSDASRIVFEILESEQIDSYDIIKEFISEMKTYGCKIAIDDFGSGYSNFEHLIQLNVDYIKIDGSLISNIDTNKASQTIVEMLAQFASKMQIKTIAEFVSTDSIKDVVETIGINESQGYLYSQPIPFHHSMMNFKQLDIIAQ